MPGRFTVDATTTPVTAVITTPSKVEAGFGALFTNGNRRVRRRRAANHLEYLHGLAPTTPQKLVAFHSASPLEAEVRGLDLPRFVWTDAQPDPITYRQITLASIAERQRWRTNTRPRKW